MSSENGDKLFSEEMIFSSLNVFALAFRGADFNLRDQDGVSVYLLLIPAVDRLV